MNRNGFSIGNVAARCDVHRSTVYRWIRNGMLKTVRISQKRQFILPEEMKRFVDANLIEAQVE